MYKKLKLTITTLDRQCYHIEIKENRKVINLKNMLYRRHALPLQPDNLALIYGGTTLMDDEQLAAYNIDERKFLIIMENNIPSHPKTPKSNAKGEVEQTSSEFYDFSTEVEQEQTIVANNCLKTTSDIRNSRCYQQAYREAHMRPECIGNILHRLSQHNRKLFNYLQNSPKELLHLMGIGKKDVAPHVVEDFLTDAEKSAIQRLKEFGFNLNDILPVYFKHNKNEQKTADYLFSQLVEENSQDSQQES